MRGRLLAAAIGFAAGVVTAGLLSGWLSIRPYLVDHEPIDDADLKVWGFMP